LLVLLISTSDYHGRLQDINGEYLTGDFIFNKSKLPIDLSEFTSNQLRKDKFTDDMLIQKININLKVEYERIIHIKITDPNNPDRWEVPTDLVDRKYSFHLHNNSKSKPPTDSFYSLSYTNETDEFTFDLKDKNNKIFYTFSKNKFLYSDRYINFESILTTNDIYGFGERGHELKLNDGVYTIWPNDTGVSKKMMVKVEEMDTVINRLDCIELI
jgi:alpha-glucosidase (family GH31 glycosyl hydrolase)